MYCLDYAERPHLGNQLSFILHELMVFFGCHSQFALYPYLLASFGSCKILQPYIAVTVQMHSDAVFASIDASGVKTSIKINAVQQIVVLYKQLLFGGTKRSHVNQPLHHKHGKRFSVGLALTYTETKLVGIVSKEQPAGCVSFSCQLL